MSRTILLVDDDALMRRRLAFHLEQAGYQVHTAANAEDAVSFVRHSPPDLVLLDIGLPGMDGLEALRELKAQHNLPVIFLTGRRRELDQVLHSAGNDPVGGAGQAEVGAWLASPITNISIAFISGICQ